MTDDADTIALKIRKARTDPEVLPGVSNGLVGREEAKNLLGIYGALSDRTIDEVCEEFAGQPFSSFKVRLIELAVSELNPIGAEIRRFSENPGHIDQVLSEGAERASRIARPILEEVKSVVGLS